MEEIRKRRDGLENEKQLLKRVQNKETSLIPMVGIEDSSEEIARQILIIRRGPQKLLDFQFYAKNLKHYFKNCKNNRKIAKR